MLLVIDEFHFTSTNNNGNFEFLIYYIILYYKQCSSKFPFP